MNGWDCDAPGCKNTATGVGGAIGLVAIGWFFRAGPKLFCPAHHPSGYELALLQARSYQDELRERRDGGNDLAPRVLDKLRDEGELCIFCKREERAPGLLSCATCLAADERGDR